MPDQPARDVRVFNVVDLETSDLVQKDKPKPEIVEIGSTLVELNMQRETKIWFPHSELFRPEAKIQPGARAAHHIRDDMLEGRSPCTAEDRRQFCIMDRATTKPAPVSVMVAHNIEFERDFLTDEDTGGLPWICTLKCAMRVWPEAPSFANGALHYWLVDQGIVPDLGERAHPMHRAGPDTLVSAHTLAAMLQRATTQEMLAWSAEPRLFPTCPIGEHRGKPWPEVPFSFLEWMTKKARDMDPDTKWNAQQEIDRRSAQRKLL